MAIRDKEACSCLSEFAKAKTFCRTVGMAILLVEDNDAFRQLAHLLLSSFGYETVAAANAAEALQAYQVSPNTFKLLLTDIDMPGMNGLALAARLLQVNPCLKVIYMSGNFPDSTPPAVPGQIDRITKPFSMVTLEAKLRELLPTIPGPRG